MPAPVKTIKVTFGLPSFFLYFSAMLRPFIVTCLLLLSIASIAQDKDERAIRAVLSNQAAAWNTGSIDAYMQGYWQHDSLLFVGKKGPTYGYNATLDNYKKSYKDTAQMGKLHFTILQVKKLSSKHRFVLGKWELKRSVGDIGGHFTLVFRKIDGKWVIIADHSS